MREESRSELRVYPLRIGALFGAAFGAARGHEAPDPSVAYHIQPSPLLMTGVTFGFELHEQWTAPFATWLSGRALASRT